MGFALLGYSAFQRHSTAECLRKYTTVTSVQKAPNDHENLGPSQGTGREAAARAAASLITPFLPPAPLPVSDRARHSDTMLLYDSPARRWTQSPSRACAPRDLLVRGGVRRTRQDVLRKPLQCVPASRRAVSTHGCPALCVGGTSHAGTVVPSASTLLGAFQSGLVVHTVLNDTAGSPESTPLCPPLLSLTFKSLFLALLGVHS